MTSSISDLEKARDLALRPHGWQYSTISIPTYISSLTNDGSHAEIGTGHNFQKLSDKISEWFAAWQPWQQRQLLCGITNRCATSQLEYLATTLEPVLHRDFITTLKKRYPTAPFREMKRRLEAKAKAKALKNFEASVRPRSTLSMKSEGPLSLKTCEDNKQRERAVSLANNVLNTYPELLIEPVIESKAMERVEDFDSKLERFAKRISGAILAGAYKNLGLDISENEDETEIFFLGDKKLDGPAVNIVGSIDLDEQICEKGEQIVEVFVQEVNDQIETEGLSDPHKVDIFGNIVLTGNETEHKIKVTFRENKDWFTSKSLNDENNVVHDKNNSNIPAKHAPKMLQARSRARSRPSLIISRPIIQQSLPNPLAKHHITVRKRVELLKSYPASSRASSGARSHRHYSARDEQHMPTQFFAENSFNKLGSMQMELRTGLVNKPTGLSDIYIPIQRMYKNSKWWNQPMQPGKKYAQPNLSNLFSQYKAQIKQIWDWITEWHDHEKLTVLVNVIKLCDSELISYLTQCLAERLQARLDISWLPDHILLKVFSTLNPNDLESCSKVCRRWKYLTSTDDLWMIKCHELGLEQGILDITRMVRLSRKPKESIDWRAAFEELILITQDARTSLMIPLDATESLAGGSSFQDDKTSVISYAERRASVLTQGLNNDDGLLKVPTSLDRRTSSLQGAERRSSIQGSLVSTKEVPSAKENRLKLGTLSKYLLKLRELGAAVKEKDEDEDGESSQKTETETASNSEEDASDAFERLRTELLQGLPQRPVGPEEVEGLSEEERVRKKSTAQTAVTMDFSKFGQSTLESRMERMRRLRKNTADEGEEAIDVRPELLQARDLKTISESSSDPRKLFIIPDKHARARLERQAAFVKSVKQVRKLQAHMDSVLCLEMDRRRLISGSMDRTIRIWDIRSGRSVHKLYGHKGGVCCIDFDNEMMVSGSWDSSVQVWDMAQFERKAVLLGHSSTVSAVKKSTDLVVSASHDGTLRLWCLSTYNCLAVHQVTKMHILCIAVDEGLILTGSSDKSMKLVDLATGNVVQRFQGHSNPVSKVLLSGNLILTGTARGQLYFWSKDTGKLEGVIQAHEGPILSIRLHNGHFYTSSGDMTIKEWDLATMSCVRILEGHKGPVNDFKVSEKYMVSCSTDGLIRVWDMMLPARKHGEVVDKIPLKVVNKHTGNYSKEKSMQ